MDVIGRYKTMSDVIDVDANGDVIFTGDAEVTDKTESKSERDPVWKTQGEALNREMKKLNISTAKLAEKVGVTRQMVHYWQKGHTAIPEEKVLKLCDIFGCTPPQIRYDILPCDHSDLIYVVSTVEKELDARGIKLDAEKKARVVSIVFSEFENMKRRNNEGLAKSNVIQNLNDALTH